MKIHLKREHEGKVVEIKTRADITFEEVIILIEYIFDDPNDIHIFQDGAQLSVADEAKEWLTSTGGKSQIALHPDITFDSSDGIEAVPVMEVHYEETPRWFRLASDWREKVTESFSLESVTWKLKKDNQKWEEGCFDIEEITDESSPRVSKQLLPQLQRVGYQ
jgi:hypothetical protein